MQLCWKLSLENPKWPGVVQIAARHDVTQNDDLSVYTSSVALFVLHKLLASQTTRDLKEEDAPFGSTMVMAIRERSCAEKQAVG